MRGWVERSEQRDGGVVRFMERPKPGHPGTMERHYLSESTVERTMGLGSIQLRDATSRRPTVKAARRSTVKAARARTEPIERVLIEPQAIDALWSFRLADGLETGGAIVGRRAGRDVRVTTLLEDRNAERTATSIMLTDEHLDAVGAALLGSWHSHPSECEDDSHEKYRHSDYRHSDDDANCWLFRAQRYERPWVSMIVRPVEPYPGWKGGPVRSATAWERPVLTAHVLDRARGIDRIPIEQTLASYIFATPPPLAVGARL